MAIAFVGCAQPNVEPRVAAPEHAVQAPAPVAAKHLPEPLRFPIGDSPALPVQLGSLVLGSEAEVVRRSHPELMASSGLRLEGDGITILPITDNPPGIVSGVAIEFPSLEALESIVSNWGSPVAGRWEGHDTRVWFNLAAKLRAVVIAPEICSGCGDCPSPSTSRNRHGDGKLLLVEQYTDSVAALSTGSRSWFFEQEEPILGATKTELQRRFGSRLNRRNEAWYLELPPAFTNSSTLMVRLDFAGERLGHYRLDFFGAGQLESAEAVQLVKDMVLPHWGEHHTASSSPWNWYGDKPRLYWEQYSPLTFDVRDPELCPVVHLAEQGNIASTASARWIAQRAREADATSTYRSLEPWTIVEERRTAGPTCALRYWSVTSEQPECQPERLKEELIAEDCCDDACLGNLAVSIRRFSVAAAKGDLGALRAFLPKAGLVREVFTFDGTENRRFPKSSTARQLGWLVDFYGLAVECEQPAVNKQGVEQVECRSNLDSMVLERAGDRWVPIRIFIDAH